MAADDARDDKAAADDESDEVLEPLKDQVAKEIGVDPDRYGGNVPAKMWGALGGHMVKRLIQRGKDAMADGVNGDDDADEDDRDPDGKRSR